MADINEPACGTRQCMRLRTCAGCGVRFMTDDADRFYCPKCDPPADEMWRPFR